MKKTFGIMLTALLLTAGFNWPSVVWAEAKYEIKVMTPEVKTALDNRKGRYDRLKAFKSQGVVGENNRGYVELLTHQEDAEQLVNAENADRKIIYRAIEEQNNLSNAQNAIEKVFAQVQRDKAGSGDKIQTEDGRWITK